MMWHDTGYGAAGASRTRRNFKGFTATSGAPNEDINWNNQLLRERSRVLYMSSAIATSAINTARTKVVGPGLSLQSTINRQTLGLTAEEAKEWEKKVEAEWRLWAEDRRGCDALGMNNFIGLQQLAFKSSILSGDCFALIQREDPTRNHPYSLRIRLLEADRISTPNNANSQYFWSCDGIVPEGEIGAGNRIFDGVEVDSRGRVVAYHICSQYPKQFTGIEPTWCRIPATGGQLDEPNILQIMTAERPDQYRGVPFLAQSIESILQLRRYKAAELDKAHNQACCTWWIETDSDPSEFPFNETGAGDIQGMPVESPQMDNLSRSPNQYEFGSGMIMVLNSGEKIHMTESTVPTAEYESFVRTNERDIGAQLGIPYDVLIKEFNSSYSASRGALLEADAVIKMLRAWFVDSFCTPVYEMWLAEAVATGRIKAAGFFDDPLIRKSWSGARWIGPVQGQLDPKKEVQAAILQTSHAIKTHEQVTRELGGGDWEENMEQVSREMNRLVGSGCVAPAVEGYVGPDEDEDEEEREDET